MNRVWVLRVTVRRWWWTPWPRVTETWTKTCPWHVVQAIVRELESRGAEVVVFDEGPADEE